MRARYDASRLGRSRPAPYSAADPELMLWVHATLVEASLGVYRRFVRRLRREAGVLPPRHGGCIRAGARRQRSRPADAGGVPGVPASELASPRICVTGPSRDVARVILEAPCPLRCA